MSKVWKAGDVISFAELNALQEKADKYDKLMAKSEKPAKGKPVKGKKK